MMEGIDVTTPFGRRAMTLAQVKDQLALAEVQPSYPVDKWRVLRDICDARSRLKLRDRALAVLKALLSFHPAGELSPAENLVVFPSNEQLSARSNGISGTTLRQNLAALVTAGLIHRRDSPNGKRYARKGEGGRIVIAYGFSLAPLAARAGEFAALAQEVEAERQQVRRLREQLTLLRRDIRKLITVAIEEGAPGDWTDVEVELVAGTARARSLEELKAATADLATMKSDIVKRLTSLWKDEKSDGNGSACGRHIQNQETESTYESEPASKMKPDAGELQDRGPAGRRTDNREKTLPLSMVLRACPDIAAYGPGGRITSWRDLMAAAVVVRSMLGVSPSAYQEACFVLGAEAAATTMACILERAGHIGSAGGYLRTLTRKATCGEFSLGAVVMAASSRNRWRPEDSVG